MLQKLPGLIGFFLILLIAYALSSNRKAINFKTVFWSLTFQIILAVLVLKGEGISRYFTWVPGNAMQLGVFVGLQLLLLLLCFKSIAKIIPAKPLKLIVTAEVLLVMFKFNLLEKFFNVSRDIIKKIIEFTLEGAGFVFGNLALNKENIGMVFAFGVLPTIIFVASIFAILYYFGVMQKVVRYLAKLMAKFLKTSGAESTSVAASIFMGQTEAPLTIRPFLPEMTMSELMTIMTAGMAHVSGGIMAAYVMVAGVDPKHLLMAVIMTAPGAIMMSKILVPETEKPVTGAEVDFEVERTDVNVIDAAARGASEGGLLCLNVIAMLIAFISLIALINGGFGFFHNALVWLSQNTQNVAGVNVVTRYLAEFFPAKFQDLLGLIFAPIAWAMGVSWKDAATVGNLMGIRMVLNEFVAFMQLGPLKAALDPKSFIISTYALCGFANFSSIAIQIGGIGALAPSRRHDLARLGLRAMLAGTLANFLTAVIAGMLL